MHRKLRICSHILKKAFRVTYKTITLVSCMFQITNITLQLDPFLDGLQFFIRFFGFYFYFYSRLNDIIFTVTIIIIIVIILGMIKIIRASLNVLNYFVYFYNGKITITFLLTYKPQACNFIKKETLAQVLSCEFCEISKNTFFTEHARATASVT